MTRFRPVLATIGVLLLTFVLSFSGVSHAQPGLTEPEAAKLDPMLKLLLDHPPADAKSRSLTSLVPPVPDELPEDRFSRVLAKEESLPAETLEQLPETIGFHPAGQSSTVDVLIKTTGDPAKLRDLDINVQSQIGDIVTANVPLGRLPALASLKSVVYVEASRTLQASNDASVLETGAPQARAEFGVSGRDVIVAIVDSGIDFTHDDFVKPDGTTRIKYLLDLSDPGDLNSDGALDGPDELGGTLYTENQINAALSYNGRVFHSTDTPKDIPDNNSRGVSSTITLHEGITIQSLAVDVDIFHSYIGDLKVVLRSPSGATIRLHDRTGGDGWDINGVFVVDAFDGQDAQGTWRLSVSDLARGDTGSLRSWGLRINQVVREEDNVGHGTHVAGTAAGNGRGTGGGEPAGTYTGMAPESDLIVVKGVRTDDAGFLSGDLVNALAFIDQKAAELGKPYVVNMSLGGQIGPHDGALADELAIDNLVGFDKPGKAVVVSAGNEGDKHIHASGRVLRGGTNAVSFEISRPTLALVDVWNAGSDTFGIGFRDPTGAGIDPTPVLPGDDACYVGGDNLVCLESSTRNPNNGDKEIFLLFFARTTGRWQFILHGNTVAANGHFDAWIQGTEFSTDVDDQMRVGMPGTAHNAITVGAYVTKDRWTDAGGALTRCTGILSASICAPPVGDRAAFSSDGPTRDGRLKPEIAAPGQMIASSYSAQAHVGSRFSMFPSDKWIVEDGAHGVSLGTSMSAPHVTGAVALVLETDPSLDAMEIRDLLTRHARTDDSTGTVPNYEWGWGKLDVRGAIEEIAHPTITELNPGVVVRGTTPDITITGTNFKPTPTVAIDSTQTTNVRYLDSHTLVTSLPTGLSAGVYDVIVINPDGGSSAPVPLYVRNPTPVLDAISPAEAPNDTDEEVVLTGSDFVGGLTVMLGSTPLPMTEVTSAAIFATCPAGIEPGAYDVTVINPGPLNPSATLLDAFIVTEPVPEVTGVTPDIGENDGSINATVVGDKFLGGAVVELMRKGQVIEGTDVTVVSYTQINCTFDLRGAGGGQWDVVVTNPGPGSPSGILPRGFAIPPLRIYLPLVMSN